MLENSAELHASNCKLVLSWEYKNNANDFNSDIEDVFCYLDELHKNITQDSAELVECLKRIFGGSTYSDQLQKRLRAKYPDIVFTIGKNLNKTRNDEGLLYQKRNEELIGENERLKVKHEHEMLSVRNDFSQQINELFDKQEKLICENKRLIAEHENEKSKMNNESQEIKDLLDKQTLRLNLLRQELDHGYQLEIPNVEIFDLKPFFKTSCIEILRKVIKDSFRFDEYFDLDSHSQNESNAVNASKDVQIQLDEMLKELQKDYQTEIAQLKILLSKKKDVEVFHSYVDISDLWRFTAENFGNSNCDSNSSVSEPADRPKDFTIRLMGYKQSSDQVSLHHRCLEEPTCKTELWNSQFERQEMQTCTNDIKVEDESNPIPEDNEKPYEQDEEPMDHDESDVCDWHLSNDERVEAEKSIFTLPLLNRMTEDEADALLSELPECEANPDLFVDPFPIACENLTDSFWTDERQKDVREVHKLTKLFGSRCKSNLSKFIPNEAKLCTYFQYRQQNIYHCNEIKCLIRNKRFPTEKHLRAHVMKYHPCGVKVFPCDYCDFPCSSNEEWKLHCADCRFNHLKVNREKRWKERLMFHSLNQKKRCEEKNTRSSRNLTTMRLFMEMHKK